MRKTPILLVLAVTLTGVTLWLYKEARDNHDADKALCGLSGACRASMSWGPTLIAGTVAAIFIVATVSTIRQS